jgi:hypothetical protein
MFFGVCSEEPGDGDRVRVFATGTVKSHATVTTVAARGGIKRGIDCRMLVSTYSLRPLN